jgi:acyl-coenzyme A thioesterase PaaI-like protein
MKAFQESIPAHHCWGCGTLNSTGLQIKSYWEGEEAVCRLTPRPEFMAGPKNVLFGGLIAAVFDCHCMCTAMAHVYRAGGREIGEAPQVWTVTASLKVDYLSPTPIEQELELRARVKESRGRKHVVTCTLTSGGAVRARAEAVAVEVPPEWATGPRAR